MAPRVTRDGLGSQLGVLVAGDNIIVTLHGTSYSVTYYKPKGSSGLLAKSIASRTIRTFR